MNRIYKTIGIMVMMIALVGCSKGDSRIKEFKVIEDYTGEAQMVDNSDKSEKELIEDIIREEMGLGKAEDKSKYKKYGVSTTNSTVVNALIIEGSSLPKVSSFSSEAIASINRQGNTSNIVNDDQYRKVLESKVDRVSNYNEEGITEYLQEKLQEGGN